MIGASAVSRCGKLRAVLGTRLLGRVAIAAALALAALAPACGKHGGSRATGADGGGGAVAGSPDGGDAAVRPDGSGGLLGRWWGVLPMELGRAGLVMEVTQAGSGTSIPVRVWVSGSLSNALLTATATGWQLLASGCWDLATPADAAGDRFDVSSCSPATPGTGVLRRSHAVRVYEAPVSPLGLTFDGSGARFAFATGDRFWLWDSTTSRLGDLGAGTKVRDFQTGLLPISVVYSPDGRYAAYLRGGPTVQCTVAILMLFDSQPGQEQPLAARVPCQAGFAHFSPDGKLLAYFANDPRDGTGADLVLWSVADGTAAGVAQKANSSARDAYLVFGASGRHLVYRGADPRYGVGFNNYEALSSYDVTTKQTTTLADSARDVTPSPDGGFVAWSGATGQVGLWDDRDGSVRVLDSATTAPTAFYGSGLSVSPDGRRFAFMSSKGAGYLYDTNTATTAALGTGGVQCYLDTLPILYGASLPTRARAAYFAAVGPGLVYWPNPSTSGDTCYTGAFPSGPFRWRDLGTGREIDGVSVNRRQAFGPHGEVIDLGTQISIWSPDRGAATIIDPARLLTTMFSYSLAVTFARDGSQVVFAGADVSDSSALWTWDAASATATQITPTLPTGRFRFQADDTSGQVVFQTSNQSPPLQLYASGAGATTTLLDTSEPPTFSASGHALAAHGERGTDQGIFAFRFGTTEAALIEEGQVLGISDTHVYFNAPDGVCVVGY